MQNKISRRQFLQVTGASAAALLLAGLPVEASGASGHLTVTPDTLVSDLRADPTFAASGVWTWQSAVDSPDTPEAGTTLSDYVGANMAQDSADALNYLADTYEAGTQVTYKVYSPEEIAADMNMPVDKVREILKIAQEPVSLETPIGEEEDSHLGDFIEDDKITEPSEAASFTLLKEQLVEVLSTLTPREEKVLKLRFGIEDGRTRTLEEVGKEFNVTRERIRQIEAKALRKLRHPSRSKKLKDFLS